MNKVKPLTDLEMHDLLRLIYPEHIRSDEDEYFHLSADVANECFVNLGDGVEVELVDLLARVCLLAMPLRAAMGGRLTHALGKITRNGDELNMIAAVRRDCTLRGDES